MQLMGQQSQFGGLGMKTFAVCLLILVRLEFCAEGAETNRSPETTNSILARPLSLADAINIALQQNPNLLKARTDLEAAQGLTVQTRAVAMPKVRASGNFLAREPSDVEMVTLPSGATFGTDRSWGTDIRLIQSIYEGGRMVSSLRTAKLTEEQSLLNFQTALEDTML